MDHCRVITDDNRYHKQPHLLLLQVSTLLNSIKHETLAICMRERNREIHLHKSTIKLEVSLRNTRALRISVFMGTRTLLSITAKTERPDGLIEQCVLAQTHKPIQFLKQMCFLMKQSSCQIRQPSKCPSKFSDNYHR